MQLGLVG